MRRPVSSRRSKSTRVLKRPSPDAPRVKNLLASSIDNNQQLAQKMRVAMYYNNRDVRLEEMPVPAIGAGELLVRVKASGVCGTDVMEWYRIKKAPLVLGHEIAGEIAAVGAGVSGYSPGDRVFVSHHVPCMKCRYCLKGHHSVCDTLRST